MSSKHNNIYMNKFYITVHSTDNAMQMSFIMQIDMTTLTVSQMQSLDEWELKCKQST